MLAGDAPKQSTNVGVYVGCMWAHEFVEVLPDLVRIASLLRWEVCSPMGV